MYVTTGNYLLSLLLLLYPVFDFHQQIDGLIEQEKGKASLGTTKKGIGPTYAAKVVTCMFKVMSDLQCV